MPRSPRIEAAGLWQHVMCRGVGGALIFIDDTDREELLSRLDHVWPEAGAKCTAWALVPNHAHFKMAASQVRLGTLMQRVLGGYAAWFNRRHGRHGHLFQDRFLSKVIREERHFQHLDAYVNGNPFSSGIVSTIAELGRYAWSGFAAMLGNAPARRFHDVELAFELAGGTRESAKRSLIERIARLHDEPATDGRVGGSAELFQFAARDVVGAIAERSTRARARRAHVDDGPLFEALLAAACEASRVDRLALLGGTRPRRIVRVRSLIAHAAVDRMGLTASAVAKRLGVSVQAVSVGCRRGRTLRDAAPADDATVRAIDAVITVALGG